MRHIQAFALAAALLAASQAADAQTVFNPAPSRIFGQAVLQQQGILTATAPNLVEGREFSSPRAVAVDTSASPAILYVADTGNNRVLAWKNTSGFANGAFADKVIGQRDFLTTAGQGPGGDLSTGLFEPVGLAVDARGNLYVIDAGNNRILRYPAPFAQTGDLLAVDLVIGQADLNGRAANAAQSAPSASSLAFSTGAGTFQAGLAFDAAGNLWVSDPGNDRVLRFPVSALGTSAANQPVSDLVLGQSDFISSSLPAGASAMGKNFLSQPSGLAFDSKGHLFIADALNRVVVYVPPFAIGELSSRIMGVATSSSGQPAVTSASTLGATDSNGHAAPPEGVFVIGSDAYVIDSGNARILGYAPFDQWPAESTAFSPPATQVIGQTNFQSNMSNQGAPQSGAASFAGPLPSPQVSGPVGAAFDGTELFVADSGNNRVLAFPVQPSGVSATATRLLGQTDFIYNAVNLIEGREAGFNTNPNSCAFEGVIAFPAGGSAVIDLASNPPHFYIADPLNNRVLGFLDYRKVNAGGKADLAIGQPNLLTAVPNFPSGDGSQTNDQGLWSPEGLAVDAHGNLYVADACNARVLRFPAPFGQPSGTMPRADLVLGQSKFSSQPIKDPSHETMRSSYGLAFSSAGDLVVSDPQANRILFFRKPAGGDFENGAAASNVFGQADFSSSLPVVFSGPRLISLDSSDQLYVADPGNNRIAVLPNVTTAGDNPPVLFSLTSLSNPFGVAVDPTSGEIWVSNTAASQVLRYQQYQNVISNPTPDATLSVFGPVSVALDPFGNPVIAEGLTNRVSFYFPAIDYTTSAGGVSDRLSGNAANYFGRFAPGMLASIFAFPNSQFGDATASAAGLPLATTLGDVQVLVDGVAAHLSYASPSQINFQVPGATPVGGFVEFQVLRASTGQILASWLFRIDQASPGLFTADGSGAGQLLAVNQDGTINSAAHPAKAGTYVSLFGTGQGLISGMPADGSAAPANILTPDTPQVFINSGFVPNSDIQYSGLAPGFVGLWQINVKVPSDAPPADVVVYIAYDEINSILDPNGIRRVTTIATTP